MSYHTSPIQTQNSFMLNSKQANTSTDTAMLSGSLIKECNTLITNFKNPYLKALFNFILNKEDAIKNILVINFQVLFYTIK